MGGVIFVFVYSIFFAVLPEMTEINLFVYYAIELVIHNTLLTVVVATVYIMIYFSFRKLAQRYRNADLNENREGQGPETNLQLHQAEREFIYGTIILAVTLIVTVWPYCITVFIAMFHEFSLKVWVAYVVTKFFLIWKFAVDPFVFAWRLRKYRKSMMMVLQRSCSCFKPSVTGTIARYQRHFSGTTVPVQSEADDNDDDVQVTIEDSIDAIEQEPAST